jgi:DNA-binding NarL/FixJ family response regulator
MKPHVLVVDDDAAFANCLASHLKLDGRADVVGCAADGLDALAQALAFVPDVVVMDVHMPVLDGVEAARRLRSLLPRARIVLVSGSGEPDDRHRAAAAGAHAFLPKSVGTEALVEAAVAS